MGPIPEPYANTTITSFPKLCRLVNFCHTELLALQETPLFVGKEARFPVDFPKQHHFVRQWLMLCRRCRRSSGHKLPFCHLTLVNFGFQPWLSLFYGHGHECWWHFCCPLSKSLECRSSVVTWFTWDLGFSKLIFPLKKRPLDSESRHVWWPLAKPRLPGWSATSRSR